MSGWPWIDASLALLVSIRHGMARLTGSDGKFTKSAQLEAKNLCDVWGAARGANKDSSFYRRQRNHLAVLVAVFTVAALLQLTIF
nr:hypothetical protein [Kibdelosporangium sp. MJ126-NF4]